MFASSRRIFFTLPTSHANFPINQAVPSKNGSAPVFSAPFGMESHQLGRRSEDIASAYLTSRGWQILDRNYRAGHKEIDIVARAGDTIAFVEVKARAGRDCGHPLEAITWAKRREIARAARSWIRTHFCAGVEYRFDAVAIQWRGSAYTLEHVPNAWRIER